MVAQSRSESAALANTADDKAAPQNRRLAIKRLVCDAGKIIGSKLEKAIAVVKYT